MRKLVDIVSICMMVIVLLAINSVDYKANPDKPIQTYQQILANKYKHVNLAKIDYKLVVTTGYYPGPECCAPFDNGETAMGVWAQKGVIAIDDKNGPFKMWDVVYVEGYGYGLCCDRGSAIKGWRADLCYNTLEDAKKHGVELTKMWKVN